MLTFFYITEYCAKFWSFAKNINQKSFTVVGKIYKRKSGIAYAYKVDEIDVDSYFFYNFLDICVLNNRIIRLSKGFKYATFSIKKFKYDDYITKQSFDLSSELHINKYEILFEFCSRNFRTVQKSSTSELYPIPDPVAITYLYKARCFFIIIQITILKR